MSTRLVAYARLSAQGLLSWSPASTIRTSWHSLAPEAGPLNLKARWFFDQPFPKFGRMDALSKLAMAAGQLVYRASNGFHGLKPREMAQVGGTMLGCLEVDAQFEATRLAGAPSPAMFVYTLPSMFQGELAIHYRLQGRCTLLSQGKLSGMAALDTALRWVGKRRVSSVLVIAADACGPLSSRLTGQAEHGEAYAYLIAGHGHGIRVVNAEGAEARPLARGDSALGCTWLDTLETHLLQGFTGAVKAVDGNESVSLQIG